MQEEGTGQKYIHPNVNTVKDRSLFKQESVLKYTTGRYNNKKWGLEQEISK